MNPASYKKRILLVVTGMSPQVVTESLYALAIKQEDKYIPTEVRIITTKTGAREARLNLLSKEKGWFNRFLKDYKLKNIELSEDYLHIITDKSGMPLDDIRTLDDNESAADSITELVRTLTQDSDSSLHVSIAGGRKTMGYYLGYALSLYGRAQDRLSHVLVSTPYENNRGFYYPTPYELPIYVRRGNKEETYDAKDAQIDLAQIPFVRLRDGLDESLKQGKTTFSKSVADAQRALPEISLNLDISKKCIIAGGEAVKMPPTELALYWLLMEKRKNGQPGFHYTMDNSVEEYLEKLGQISGKNSAIYVNADASFTLRDKSKNMSKDYINPIKNKVNKRIQKGLGKRMAGDYEIMSEQKIQGTQYKYYSLKLSPIVIFSKKRIAVNKQILLLK